MGKSVLGEGLRCVKVLSWKCVWREGRLERKLELGEVVSKRFFRWRIR